MLTVTYAECHIKAPYAECHIKAPYAECYILNVVMLSIVAPNGKVKWLGLSEDLYIFNEIILLKHILIVKRQPQ